MLVVLSRSSSEDNYTSWLKRLHPHIELADAYSAGIRSLDNVLRQCSGILLTGGADVNPALYGMAEEAPRCEGVDEKLDQVELCLVEIALERKLPLLAICRGIQIINVFFNGSLIIDIAVDYGNIVEHRNQTDVCHTITIAKNSNLYNCGKADKTIVNSSHHQAIGVLGTDLTSVARSDDNLIEAVELKPRFSHPFFLGVQWHPERMEFRHPMSECIGRSFLRSAMQYDTTSLH